MKYITLAVLFLLALNPIFTEGKIMAKNEYIPARYVVLSEEITSETAQILSKRHHMRLMGTGGGLADCVNILSLSFQIVGPIDQAELREILIDSVETFLSALNSNEELRPHLSHYPFSPQGIEIEIFVMDTSKKPIYDPYISIGSAKGGTLAYKTISTEGGYKFKSMIREDYEEAKQKITRIGDK